VSGWPLDPVVVEIDTWVWLDALSRQHGRRVTLGELTPVMWDATLPPDVDAVWLMGVWERSPYAARRARDVWADQARELLPDLTGADVPGSPYAVRRYAVDEHLGGEHGLATARAQLADRGLRLMLDHVPNHVAVEHRWLRAHPQVAVEAADDDLAREPDAFLRLDDRVLACGRDPNLPAWSDVVQLNAFAPALRHLTIDTLRAIADRCDGVRVDMAMLLLDDVVERTWGERVGPPLDEPFWVEVIGALRATHPDVHLVAEAYWDRQPDLLAQGFDRCYDKDLTDALLAGEVADVTRRLGADLADHRTTLRFLENHDERRAITAFGPERIRAAAAVVGLAPGALLLFDGQLDGRRLQVPVGIGRRPDEPLDPALRAWYEALLRVRAEVVRPGAQFTVHSPRTNGLGSDVNTAPAVDAAAPAEDAAAPAEDAAAPAVVAASWSHAALTTHLLANLGAAAVRVELDVPVEGGRAPAHLVGGRAPADLIDGRRLTNVARTSTGLRADLAPGEVVVVAS
jgi:hypothetical protein